MPDLSKEEIDHSRNIAKRNENKNADRKLSKDMQKEDELRVRLREIIASLDEEALVEANEILRKEDEKRRLVERERGHLIKKLATVQEEEHRRIARDLHDYLGQQLTVLRLNLKMLKSVCNVPELKKKIEETEQIAKRIDSDVGFLAHQLHPNILDDSGLCNALVNYVEQWSEHFGVKVKIHTKTFTNINLSAEIEINLYRIAQEILNNIAKHSKAGQVNVVLGKNGSEAFLIIEDNGIGFNSKKTLKKKNTLGLVGIRERALLAGGTVEIESNHGVGTTVFVRVLTNFTDERIEK